MKKVMFIYNPNSGEGVVAIKLDAIVELFQNNGYSICPYRLTFDDTVDEMISDLRHYEFLLIAGGDGTVNFMINILQREGIDIPIALLSVGTANDFAAVLGTDPDIIAACRNIIRGKVMSVDLGCVNGEYFVNVFSTGLFTSVSQKTPTLMKNTFGKLAYYMGGLGEITSFHWMDIKVTSDTRNYEGKCLIFFVFNGRTAGKMKIAHSSQIDDGLLDVVIMRGKNPFEAIITSMKMLTSLPLTGESSDIIRFKCSKLKVECATDERTDIDGQPGPKFPIEVKCLAKAQRVIIPR